MDDILQAIDILCIGETGAGKSTFLHTYTQDTADDPEYRLYLKQIGGTVVTFHELSREQELYLSLNYDGVLFFVDLVNYWRVEETILRWLQLHSRCTGTNIFKIPISVMVMKTDHPSPNTSRWKEMLQQELSFILTEEQIIYYQSNAHYQQALQIYIQRLDKRTAAGIKCTNYTIWSLYGVGEICKTVWSGVKLTFYRLLDVYRKKKDISLPKIHIA